jgi:hypothetical protein
MIDDLQIVHDSADELETTAVALRGNGAVVQRGGNSVDPMELIRFAIESKTPAAELSQLVALAQQVEERNAVRAFNTALAAFQRECPPVQKNKSKGFETKGGGELKWSYAEMDVIEAHIKPYLEKHELAYVFDQKLSDNGAMCTITCTLSHILGHFRQANFTVPTLSNSAASPQQKVGAAASYAARRALGDVLGINITDKQAPDDEVDATPITEDQARELVDLINEKKRGRNDEKVFMQRFLDKYRIESVDQLRATEFAGAVALLRGMKTKETAQ